jgi:predicted SprT family Zn-dependent metalloprotease
VQLPLFFYPSAMTVADLQAEWSDLNARYFAGRLQPIAIVWTHRLTSSAGLFQAKRLSHGEHPDNAESGHRVIRLSVSLLAGEPIPEVVGTLAHEMIHQWQYEILRKRASHGPDFHRMMAVMNRDGLNITVRHDLAGVEAFLRYSWQCEECGYVYRRQRRTITHKHRCGKCSGGLKEITG